MESEMLVDLKKRLEKVFGIVSEDIATIRSSSAKPDLVSNLIVEVYGEQKMKILELASVSTPDSSLIVIKPWDGSVLSNIERAISNSDLGLSASVSENVVRVPVPVLTEERRLEFVKLLHQKLEAGRVMLRQVRADIKKRIESLKGEDGVSENDIEAMKKEMESEVAEYVAKIEEMGKKKEDELMRI